MLILSRRRDLIVGPIQTLTRQVPLVDQVRHRHNVRISKPRQAPVFRARLLELSKPVWEEQPVFEDLWKDCNYAAKEKERKEWEVQINQLEKFYVKEMLELFEKSQIIGFFFCNPMKPIKRHAAWQNARRAGMELEHYHYRVGAAGLKGTQWENCLHFWFKFPGDSNLQPIVFSPELNADKLLKFERKVPEFTLLGAVVGNRIMSKKQIQEIKNLPSLEQSRGELVSILGYQQQRTLQLLTANQQQLSTNLSQLIKDKLPNKEENTETEQV